MTTPVAPSRLYAMLVVSLMMFIAACQSPRMVLEPTPTAKIYYTVVVDTPQTAVFKVRVRPEGLRASSDAAVRFNIPAWAPGAYQFTEYGQYVKNVAAIGKDGKSLAVVQLNKNAWQISNAAALAEVRYDVTSMNRPDLLWPEITELNDSRGYFNATNVFGYFDSLKNIPCKVSYQLPAKWQVASAIEDSANSFTASAADYDELVDAPVYLSPKLVRYNFSVLGKPHSITMDTENEFKPDSLIYVTTEIVKAHQQLFGELPYKNYLFIHRLVVPKFGQVSFGALEHRNSSAYYMPVIDANKVRTDQFANVISHEFFHLWSPKRIHTSLLGPFDYQSPVKTKTIWFAEGVTDYYADLLLLRAGLSDVQIYLDGMMNRILAIKNSQGYYDESLESLSMRLPTIEAIDEIIPFYVKGPVVAMLMDIELRDQTDNKFSLDDLMRSMNETYGKHNLAFADDDLLNIINSKSGANLTAFHAKYIAGKDTLPDRDILKKAGLRLADSIEVVPSLGYFPQPDDSGRIMVAQVIPGYAAEAMGMKVGDEVIKVNGVGKENESEFSRLIFSPRSRKIGELIVIEVLRNKTVVKLTGIVGSRRITTFRLRYDANASEKAQRIRKSLYGE